MTLGNPGAPNALGREIFVAKVNPSGKWVWAVHAGSSGNDEGGRGVVALVDGSAIVTGFFNGAASFTPTASAQVSLTSAGGDLSNGWEQSRGVSVLPDGSAVVTGFYEDRAPTFTPVPSGASAISLPAAGQYEYDAFVAKINADGEWLWAAQVSTDDDAQGRAVVALADGSVIVTGYFSGGTASFSPVSGSASPISMSNVGLTDAFVAKISTSGEWVWAVGVGGTGAATRSHAVAAFGTSSILITGRFTNTVPFGSSSLTSSGSDDIFVARISAAGVFG